jgi:hypothetical protein
VDYGTAVVTLAGVVVGGALTGIGSWRVAVAVQGREDRRQKVQQQHELAMEEDQHQHERAMADAERSQQRRASAYETVLNSVSLTTDRLGGWNFGLDDVPTGLDEGSLKHYEVMLELFGSSRVQELVNEWIKVMYDLTVAIASYVVHTRARPPGGGPGLDPEVDARFDAEIDKRMGEIPSLQLRIAGSHIKIVKQIRSELETH